MASKKKVGKTIHMPTVAVDQPLTKIHDAEHAEKIANALTSNDDNAPFTGSNDGKAWYAGAQCHPQVFVALIKVEHAHQVFNESKFDWPDYPRPVDVNVIWELVDTLKNDPKLAWADSMAREQREQKIKSIKERLYPHINRGKALVEKARHKFAQECIDAGVDTSPWELEQLGRANFGRINSGFIGAGCPTVIALGKNGKSYTNPDRNKKRSIHTTIMLADAEAILGKSKIKQERFDSGSYTITDDDNELLGAMTGGEGLTDTDDPRISMSPQEEEINEAALLDQIQSAG